jgi:hypothetical protein
MADRLPKPPPPSYDDSKFKPHRAGNHAMIVVDIIDLGLNHEVYQGDDKGLKHKVAFLFASGERNGNDELITVAKEVTLSAYSQAPIVGIVENILGKAFTDEELENISDLVAEVEGKGAMVNVEVKRSAKGRDYANAKDITTLPDLVTPKMLEDIRVACADYKRADFWNKKKEEYAKAAAKYRKDNPDKFADTDAAPF